MIHEKMADLLIRSGYPRDRLVTFRNPAVGFTGKRIPVERNRTIYFVGRLEAEKGIEDAITAAKRAERSVQGHRRRTATLTPEHCISRRPVCRLEFSGTDR